MKDLFSTLILVIALSITIVFGSYAEANANAPLKNNNVGVGPGNDGSVTNNETKGGAEKSTKATTVNLAENEWVVIEVIDENSSTKKEDQVVVEKKNISQVAVTWVEVRSCQKNATPEDLVPILKEISQSSKRRVYLTEEKGKKIYYISPVTEDQSTGTTKTAEEPNSLNLPVLWQIKI